MFYLPYFFLSNDVVMTLNHWDNGGTGYISSFEVFKEVFKSMFY